MNKTENDKYKIYKKIKDKEYEEMRRIEEKKELGVSQRSYYN